MSSLLISLALLIGGYFIYGAIAERIFGTDPKRPTPATTMADGIDYIAMPTWKVFLIQFLNIAGMGPIFGAIMGIMFGPAALLWIVFGTIFAGAVHDFVGAMMSMREGGVSLPEIVGRELGGGVKHVMRVFSLILLILVGTVFVISPAEILASLTPESLDKIFWVGIILIYYILATMLPIDKLIGNLYPVFGVLLLFMALGLLGMMLFGGVEIPVGFGDGNVEAILKDLYKNGYDGFLSLEPHLSNYEVPSDAGKPVSEFTEVNSRRFACAYKALCDILDRI